MEPEGQLVVNIQHVYFQLLCLGEKSVEGRLATPKYSSLRRGQMLWFRSEDTDEKCARYIKKVEHFPSFKEMVEVLGTRSLLGDLIKSVDEACQTYLSFPGYKEGEQEYGVIAIHL